MDVHGRSDGQKRPDHEIGRLETRSAERARFKCGYTVLNKKDYVKLSSQQRSVHWLELEPVTRVLIYRVRLVHPAAQIIFSFRPHLQVGP